MKDYPSIPRATPNDTPALFHIFAKPDGSNLRFEWDRKRGWWRFGTRHRLLSAKDEAFGEALAIFDACLAAPLDEIARRERWEGVVVFAEFWGDRSFAGQHEPGDPKRLTLFDIGPYKKGILGPAEFLRLTEHISDTPQYFGERVWDEQFVQRVRAGEFLAESFEGVVGKAGSGHHLAMRKAKSQAWIERVRAKFAPADAERLIAS